MRTKPGRARPLGRARRLWQRFWMRYAGLSTFGRLATRLAAYTAPPYKARCYLARYHPQGYVAPSAQVWHKSLQLNRDVFLGDRVIVYQAKNGGPVKLEHGVHLYGDITIETGEGGEVEIGAETHIQPRCQLSAYKGSIRIGRRVEIAPNTSFYPYNHGSLSHQPIRTQPLQSKGDIVIHDDAWLGVGVTVLDGVTIGEGAIIGAGSVVASDIPAYAIAAGVPAQIIKMRTSEGNVAAQKLPHNSHPAVAGRSINEVTPI